MATMHKMATCIRTPGSYGHLQSGSPQRPRSLFVANRFARGAVFASAGLKTQNSIKFLFIILIGELIRRL